MLICSGHGEPLRTVIIGSGTNPLGPTILEALRRRQSRVLHLVAPTGRKETTWAASQLDPIRSFAPDLVIVCVGPNHGEGLARVQQLAKQVSASIVPDRAFIIAEIESLDELSNIFTKRTRLRTAALSSADSTGSSPISKSSWTSCFRPGLAQSTIRRLRPRHRRPRLPVHTTWSTVSLGAPLAAAYSRSQLTTASTCMRPDQMSAELSRFLNLFDLLDHRSLEPRSGRCDAWPSLKRPKTGSSPGC